jgi:transposase-like protein
MNIFAELYRTAQVWSEEHLRCSKRDLSTKRYLYSWADGIPVQARARGRCAGLLVIIGATPEGKKELVGLIDDVRESAQSWKDLLLDLKRRGLAIGLSWRSPMARARVWAGDRGSMAQDPRPALLGAQDCQYAQ